MNHLHAPLLALALGSTLGLATPALHAQEADPPPTTESATESSTESAPKAEPPQYLGTVDANAVYVRASAGETGTPLLKLDRGDNVVTVDLVGDWLKILPPEKTYLTFPKASLELGGREGTGRVVQAGYARYGSALTKQAYEPAARLTVGADVKVVGSDAESWYLAPPPGVYAYIRRQDVVPGGRVRVVAGPGGTLKIVPFDAGSDGSGGTPPTKPADDSASAFHPGARPTPSGSTPASRPAAPPVDAAVAQRLKGAEAAFESASTRPVGEQPIDRMLAEYQAVADASPAKGPTRQIAEYRIQVLQSRRAAQAELQAAMAAQRQGASTRQSLTAENQELAGRVEASAVKVYAAVGTLRPSSLQMGGRPLYRLTDPANGRTVVYVRSDDPQFAALSGQFVGVTGEVVDDAGMSLKYVTPTAVEAVDPARVGSSVAAQLAPQSVIGR